MISPHDLWTEDDISFSGHVSLKRFIPCDPQMRKESVSCPEDEKWVCGNHGPNMRNGSRMGNDVQCRDIDEGDKGCTKCGRLGLDNQAGNPEDGLKASLETYLVLIALFESLPKSTHIHSPSPSLGARVFGEVFRDYC